MDPFFQLMAGLATALEPRHLLMCFLGVFLGQIVGVLPGIGPSAAIALLLPLTFGGDPTSAVIMFAGIYYGAQYGGTLTSVLVSVPGESSSVMTALDGHQMALQGRAGAALGIAAIGSFIAGTLGTVGLMLLAPPLAQAALAFGPPEYFALVVLGLTALAAVGGSLSKGLAAGVAGLALSTVGIDPQSGASRFDFGQIWLLDGIEFIVLTVALFGVAEVLNSCHASKAPPPIRVEKVLPTREDWRRSRAPIARGSLIGFIIGVLPATGATIASFVAYIVEKKLAKDPSRFGKGAIEGVAGPEASNNAAASGAMVPMFALGVPGSGTTAIILGALVMFGLRPGPELFTKNADLVWAVIASMFVGNLILLVLNLPLAPLFGRLLRVPYRWLYPPILALCVAGVFAQANSIEDCWLLMGFGLMGWLMMRHGWPAAPMVLGLVLGPIFETAMRQSLTLSHGSGLIFVTRPISAALLGCALAAVLGPLLWQALRRPRAA
jgi:putative tricarboxylic transport membrane protein